MSNHVSADSVPYNDTTVADVDPITPLVYSNGDH